ncbi:hypothetical protein HDEF_2265 [Candidatus Hamiltonella defensa 5AT (Acyrthosiphon pisum)]|uniref:Uncharacterized protein n=1 Tax=Hamiltonella defensa subsp. Acyrthosiphon pisum (strain 5AT) TaxID=572265 RepID=C4K8F0_HAMD5|nr:hypothetical protein HDEF_2265 [Candidatus Hamiltonella defensa 5AT (Acyrthosiphon pisum)]
MTMALLTNSLKDAKVTHSEQKNKTAHGFLESNKQK